MRKPGQAVRRLFERSVSLVLVGTAALPALAWAQYPDSATSQTTTRSSASSTTTTSTTTEWASDWRLWALVGVVLLVIIVIAATRGSGRGDRTTVVK